MSVFVVYLRRPSSDDKRSDPFWEFGSFGRTGCHSHNLLSRNCRIEPGVSSVLFLQGGEGCIRAVALAEVSDITPFTIAAKDGKPQQQGRELKWKKIRGPYVFEEAPFLIGNHDGRSDFPAFSKKLGGTQRDTRVAGAASKLRARATELEMAVALEVREVFARWKGAKASAFHETIEDGPWRRRMAGVEAAERKDREARYAALTKGRSSRPCR